MEIRRKGIAALGVGCLAVGLITAAPSAAGVRWSQPQEVSSRYGWQVSLSDDGEVAAWIRVGSRKGPGPVHTSVYRGGKKGWSKSKQVAGSAEATRVMLSGDGGSALMRVPGGYAVARRSSGNKWASAETIATGGVVGGGGLSADGSTMVWIEESTVSATPPPTTPPASVPPSAVAAQRRLHFRVRTSDGSWAPEAQIGTYSRSYNPGRGEDQAVALSRDGSTVAWLDDSEDIVAAVRSADGRWSAPTVVQEYGGSPQIGELQLSSNGSRITWRSSGSAVLTSTRAGSEWAAPTYVMQNYVAAVSMSPNGRVVAYGQQGPDRLRVRRYVSGRWTRPQTLGPSQDPQIAVRNKAVAWVESQGEGGSPLRVSLLKKGKWTAPTTVAPNGAEPTLSATGDTLAWAGAGVKKIFSVTR